MSTIVPPATKEKPYYSTDIYRESVLHNSVQPGEEIFGFFKRVPPNPPLDPSSIHLKAFDTFEHDGVKAIRHQHLQFEGQIDAGLIKTLTDLASRQEITLLGVIRAILKTETAFEQISKQEFSRAMIAAIQQPECAGYYAFNAIGRKYADIQKNAPLTFNETGVTGARLSDILIITGRSGFMLSGEEFRTGAFEAEPFTAEEVKALPYLMGVVPDLYANAGVDYSAQLKSTARKLATAGFETEANLMIDVDVEKGLKASKPTRRVVEDENSGPGF
ncbi:hypothetical protein V0M98_35520 (plasmid) [Pseudomonas silesiensis]|uniref:hypothetical protein n=1 Tax=Pseudomonas silesiensis TaxID=1853130 RepID=UPI0030CC52BB